MAWDVHIHVCFRCDENETVAELAKKYLNEEGITNEAGWFLQDLCERKGTNSGPKGGLSL